MSESTNERAESETTDQSLHGNCSDPAGASSESIDENHPDDLGMIRDKM